MPEFTIDRIRRYWKCGERLLIRHRFFCFAYCIYCGSHLLHTLCLLIKGNTTIPTLQWLKRYTTALSINIIAYLMVLLFNHLLLHTVYYYISVGCSLFIVYMELYDRIIGKPTVTHSTSIVGHKDEALIGRLDAFMQNNYAWRDPNLSLTTLASALFTNRTTLASVMHKHGLDTYSTYINKLRIEDFLNLMRLGRFDNYQDAFFFVGYRSRSAALRNFKQCTGKTPSDYFQSKFTQ